MKQKYNPVVDPIGRAAQKIAAIIVLLQNNMTRDALKIGQLLRDLRNDLGKADFEVFVAKTLQNGWTVEIANHYIAKAEQLSSWTTAEWDKLGSAIKRTLFQVGVSNDAVEALRKKAHSLLGTVRIILRPTYESIVGQFQAIRKSKFRSNFTADAKMRSRRPKKLKGGFVKRMDTITGVIGKVEEVYLFDRNHGLSYYSIRAIVSGKIVASYEGTEGQISLVAKRYCYSLI